MIIAKYKATVLFLHSDDKNGEPFQFFSRKVFIFLLMQANVRDVYAGLTGADGEEIRWDFFKG